MKILMYFVTFSDYGFEMFKLCYKSLKENTNYNGDVILLSEKKRTIDGVKNVIAYDYEDNDIFKLKMGLQPNKYFNINGYDFVWRLDSDILFTKYFNDYVYDTENIVYCNAVTTKMNEEVVNTLFSEEEKEVVANRKAINSGVICIPNKYIDFFNYWQYYVNKIIYDKLNLYGLEQAALNYAIFTDKYKSVYFDDNKIYFPVSESNYYDKSIILHFAGYGNDKVKIICNYVLKYNN